jgi:hypothetical protein
MGSNPSTAKGYRRSGRRENAMLLAFKLDVEAMSGGKKASCRNQKR